MKTHTTSEMVRTLKNEGQDFEWYPTTAEMIAAIKHDMNEELFIRAPSVLDVGAGDGRVLNELTSHDRYAIEVSKPLLQAMDNNIFIVGTNFHEQTLIDKRVDCVFSNPPYREYQEFASRIIREANASVIYLVIPQRWENSTQIQDAIAERGVTPHIIYTGDFLDAERKARAKVHIVRFNLDPTNWHASREERAKHRNVVRDPFELWFNTHFKISASKDKLSDWERREQFKESIEEGLTTNHELVEKEGVVEMLARFYERDLEKLMGTYQSLADVDAGLLAELNVDISGVKKALRERIKGLKYVYWNELFNRLDSVTSRLTADSRQEMLEVLLRNTSVDFSRENAHAIAIWVVKNANNFLDTQLVVVMKKMFEYGNTENYKSNQRTFGKSGWRYTIDIGDEPGAWSHIKLDYRIVLQACGGLDVDSWDGRVKGLSSRAAQLLNDLLVIARNVGFDTVGMATTREYHWDTGVKNEFFYRLDDGSLGILFDAKAFKNGNLHIKFNSKFICALNCEFGRLMGWLKTREQAAEELDIPMSDTTAFGHNLQLGLSDLTPRLGLQQPECGQAA